MVCSAQVSALNTEAGTKVRCWIDDRGTNYSYVCVFLGMCEEILSGVLRQFCGGLSLDYWF